MKFFTNEGEERANCLARVRDENAGAIFYQQIKYRGAASKNFVTTKFYAEPNPQVSL